MAALGSLVVKLALEYAQFTGGLDKSEQAALAYAKRVQDTMDGFRQRAAITATAVAGSLAAAFGVGTLTVWTKGVVDAIDGLNDLKDAAGTTVENVSALEDIAARTGTRFEVAGSTLVKFNQVLTQAADKGSATSKMLQGLGLDAEKLRQIDPAEALRQTAVALSQYADDGDKARVVQQLFGKSVAEVAPFLKDLAEQTELTATVTTKQAEEAEKLNRQFMALEKNTTDAARSLVSNMLPAINSVLQAMNAGGLRAGIDRLGNELFDWEGNAQRKAINNAKGEIEAETARVQQLMTGLALVLERDPTNAVAQRRMAALQANLDKSLESMKSRLKSAEQLYFKFDSSAGGGRGAVNPEFVDPRQSVGDIGKTTKDVKAVVSEYDKLIQKLGNDVPKAAAEAQAAQMGYNKSQTEFIALAGSPVWSTFTNEQRAAVAVKYESIIAGEQAVDLAKEEAKAAADQTKAIAELRAEELKRVVATEQRVAGMQEGNLALQQEIELIGLNDEAQVRLLQQRNEAIILTKEATLAELERASAISGTMTREQIALQAEIEALRERNQLLGAKHDKTVVAKATQDAKSEWTKFTDSVYDGLTDSLYRGFESGKGFFKTFWDGIKNTAKTTVLKFGVQGVMTGVSGFLGFGGSAAGAAGAAGSGGILSTASNAYSLYNTGSQAYTLGSQYLSGSMSGANALGSMYANATGGGLDALLATNGAYGTAGGGAAGGGMGAMAGAGAFAAVAALVLNALGAFRSERKNGGGLSGTLGGGQLSAWEEWREGGTLFSGPSFSKFNPADELESQRAKLAALQASGQGATQMAATLQTIVDNLTEQYGEVAAATAAQSRIIQTAYDGMRDSASNMAAVLGLSSDKVRDFTTQFNVELDGLKPEEQQAKIAEALATANNELAQQLLGTWETTTKTLTRVVSENIGSMGEDASLVFEEITNTITGTRYVASEYAKEGEKAIDTLLRLSTSMSLVNETADALGYEMGQASLAAAAAASNIVEAFGGVEAFTQTMGSFFQNFFSEEEQRAATARQVSRALGAVGFEVDPAMLEGATRPAIRAFVEAVGEQFGFESKEYVAAINQANVLAGITDALPPATAATQANTVAVDDAGRAAEEAANKWQSITDALLGDRDSLAIELLRAQGQEEAALAAERALGIVGMDAYQVALFDSNAALRLQITSLERMREVSLQLASELPDVLDKFRTPEQRTTARYDSIAADLQKAGIATDTANLAGLLANATKDQIALAAIEVAGFAGTTDEMRLALVRAASGLSDLKDSAEQTAQANVDSAFQTLQRLVADQRGVAEASRTAAQESVSALTAVNGLLRTNVRRLLGDVDGTARMLAGAGGDFITQALATLRGGGAMPERDALAEAIEAASGGLTTGNFASQFDLDVARLEMAADLSDLERIGGKQLSEAQQAQRVAENQLKALDAILNNAQAEMDVFKGIRDGVVTSIPEALALLARSMGGGQAAAITAPGSGVAYTAAQVGLADGFARDRIAAGDIAGLYRGYTENGISSADAAYHLQRLGHNVTQADVLAAVKAAGLPAFATGGWHAGGWAMVGEEGPELAYMPPAQIYNARDTNRMLGSGSGGADMAEMSRAFAAIAGLDTTLRVVSGVQVRLLHDMSTLFAAWNRDGLPPERVETPVTEEEGEPA